MRRGCLLHPHNKDIHKRLVEHRDKSAGPETTVAMGGIGGGAGLVVGDALDGLKVLDTAAVVKVQ